jgi:hypothetical protein
MVCTKFKSVNLLSVTGTVLRKPDFLNTIPVLNTGFHHWWIKMDFHQIPTVYSLVLKFIPGTVVLHLTSVKVLLAQFNLCVGCVQEQATIAAHAIKTEFFRPATVSEICTRLITAFLPLTPEDLGKIIFLPLTPGD